MVLRLTKLRKTLSGPSGAFPLLNGISLDLKTGQSLAMTGESGSGKSTLLHLIAALDTFDGGEIEVDGVSLSSAGESQRTRLRREVVSLVFQQFNLIPSLDVADNIALHAGLAGRRDAEWERYLIQTLGLAEHQKHYPEQLSGGQQQRVAIARAMALRPKLLLADEPTGNLDETTAQTVLDLMLSLVQKSGSALFLVTHSTSIASQLNQKLLLRKGEVH